MIKEKNENQQQISEADFKKVINKLLKTPPIPPIKKKKGAKKRPPS